MPPPMGSWRPAPPVPVAHLIVPLAILVVLCAPSVTFMLPATEDYLGEEVTRSWTACHIAEFIAAIYWTSSPLDARAARGGTWPA